MPRDPDLASQIALRVRLRFAPLRMTARGETCKELSNSLFHSLYADLKNSSIPLSKSQSWGRGVGVLAAPDAYECGSDLPPPLSVNSIFGSLKTFPQSFEGFTTRQSRVGKFAFGEYARGTRMSLRDFAELALAPILFSKVPLGASLRIPFAFLISSLYTITIA